MHKTKRMKVDHSTATSAEKWGALLFMATNIRNQQHLMATIKKINAVAPVSYQRNLWGQDVEC